MNDGFVVISDDDGILYGHGDTAAKAWADAQEWIEEAVRQQVRDSIHESQSRGVPVWIDGTWHHFPATAALRASLDLKGGHDQWVKRPDGTVDVRPSEDEVPKVKT